MGEDINPPYSADIFASIHFIIELDPVTAHGGDIKSKKDKWRNKNIYEQYGVPTVRLQPEDVLKEGGLAMAFKEMLSQLRQYQK